MANLVNSGVAKAGTAAKPVATAPAISGYFNAQGQPTFATSPSVTSLPNTPTGTAPATTTTTPAPVAPYLTPTQQAALNTIITNNNNSITGYQQTYANDVTTTNQDLQAAQLTHDNSTNSTNQSTAARGMFQSSIRDNDLADINSALTTRQNTLNTALNSDFITMNQNIKQANDNITNAQGTANGEGVENAQAATPVLPTTTTTPGASATNPAAPPPGQAGVAAPTTSSVGGASQLTKVAKGKAIGGNKAGANNPKGISAGVTSTGVPVSGLGGSGGLK